MKAEQEGVYIAAGVGLAVLLLFCIIRRKRGAKTGTGTGNATPTTTTTKEEQEVKEDFKASSSAPVHEENSVSSNSLFKLFKTEDMEQIAERFQTLTDVSEAIGRAGLQSCNLIFGIDYTGSNYMQGKKTFGGKCLHHIGPDALNPYQQVISILGETLETFSDDGGIPAYGFGDTFTRDHSVFSISNMGPCKGFQEVLRIYNEMTPKVRLGGPTNFAPLINQALDIVKKNKSYHILVIVADGQVTAERDTVQSIVEASSYPLSIIMVGVGDGPWDTMHLFHDKLPARRFPNFRFVNFSEIGVVGKDGGVSANPQTSFALQALVDIPDQYKAIHKLGLMEFAQ